MDQRAMATPARPTAIASSKLLCIPTEIRLKIQLQHLSSVADQFSLAIALLMSRETDSVAEFFKQSKHTLLGDDVIMQDVFSSLAFAGQTAGRMPPKPTFPRRIRDSERQRRIKKYRRGQDAVIQRRLDIILGSTQGVVTIIKRFSGMLAVLGKPLREDILYPRVIIQAPRRLRDG
jgi:hypothetical protein